MKTYKVILLFTVFLISIIIKIHAQNSDSTLKFLAELPMYEVIDSEIYEAIDSVMFYTEDCIYAILNKPYYLGITIWNQGKDISMRIESLQFSSTLIDYGFNWRKNTEKGFFYYKDKLILVEFRGDFLNLFFKSTDSISALYYKPDEKLYPQILMGYESARIVYNYINGKLVVNDITPCSKSPYFIYTVKESDTWEGIAEECGCSVEIFKNFENHYNEILPEKGYKIIIQYEITEEGLKAKRLQ